MRQAEQLVRLRQRRRIGMAMALGTILALCASLGFVGAQPPAGGTPGAGGAPSFPPPSSNVSVVATGFTNPRGLRFGPDGTLYVAEAGTGGTNSTVGQCTQVPELGPYKGGKTADIAKVSGGSRTVVASGLPSTVEQMGDVIGVADVDFLGGTMYALIAGGGCSHGNPDAPNAVLSVSASGAPTVVANLSAYLQAHPVAKPDAEDFEPDGTWYSMTVMNGALYALEPNHGELVRITPDGQVTRVVDISASQGHIVPTTVIASGGNLYFSNLCVFPAAAGCAKVWKVTPDGNMSVVASGLQEVLGLAFDSQGRLYALQMSSVPNQGPVPGTGNIVRMNASGGWDTIAYGLVFPTAMTFGADGMLYVSNYGFGPPLGQVVKVNVNQPSGPQPAAPASPSATAPAASPSAAAPTATPRPATPTTAPPAAPKTGEGGGLPFIRRLGDG